MSTYYRAVQKLEEEVIPVPGSTPIPDSPALRKEIGKEKGAGPGGGEEGNPALTFHFSPEDVSELRSLLQNNPNNRVSPQLRNFLSNARS